jgi:hypothetical protein
MNAQPKDYQWVSMETGPTPKDSIEAFFHQIQQNSKGDKTALISMLGVGLVIDGHSAPFDLMFFPSIKTVFAIDSKDFKYVYKMLLS